MGREAAPRIVASTAERGKRAGAAARALGRERGPCGNTVVTDVEVAAARRLFLQELPAATSGLSIVQRLAVSASAGPGPPGAGARSLSEARSDSDGEGGDPSRATPTTMSQRVVNSHLEYLRKFRPFREGRFSKDTLYEFLFFAVLENRMRMSYARRVLRNVLSYVRRYLQERGHGTDVVTVAIEKAGGRRSVRLDVRLTPESLEFFRDNPRGTVVQSKLFYRLVNSIGDRTNNQRLKNAVCEARRPRDLVFSERQNAALLAFAVAALRAFGDKYARRLAARGGGGSCYGRAGRWSGGESGDSRVDETLDSFVSPAHAANTVPKQLAAERATFEFAAAFLLGSLTGARAKSTISRLTVGEIDGLVRGGTVEKLTKGSFARVFVPDDLVYRGGGDDDDRDRDEGSCGARDGGSARSVWPSAHPPVGLHRATGSTPFGPQSVAESLHDATLVRRDPLLYPTLPADAVAVEERVFFVGGARRLDYTFDRVYAKLFGQRRPNGVLWHSQRRRYLGTVNDRCGAVTASKSVGHADVETTMSYINKSVHREDTNRRAGSAVRDETLRLLGAAADRAPSMVGADTDGGRGSGPYVWDAGSRHPRDGALTLSFDA